MALGRQRFCHAAWILTQSPANFASVVADCMLGRFYAYAKMPFWSGLGGRAAHLRGEESPGFTGQGAS